MRRSRPSFVALALFLGGAAPLAGQNPDLVTGGAAFLLIPVGGKGTALGQTGAADGGSSEAAFWNPAGLARMSKSEVAIHHARTFISTNTALSAYFSTAALGVFGVSAYLVDYGSQEITDINGQQIGRISPKNIELLTSYSTELVGPMTFGVNFKLIQFRQDCSGICATAPSVAGTTHAVDVGVQYSLGQDALRLGAVLKHAGFRLQLENRDQADPLPTRFHIGAAYRAHLPSVQGSDAVDVRFLLDLQNSLGRYADPDATVGLELGYADVARVRTGYAFLSSESSGPSVGVGLRFENLVIDFAQIFFDSSTFDEPVHISIRLVF